MVFLTNLRLNIDRLAMLDQKQGLYQQVLKNLDDTFWVDFYNRRSVRHDFNIKTAHLRFYEYFVGVNGVPDSFLDVELRAFWLKFAVLNFLQIW